MWTRRLEREDRGREGAERRADSGGSSTLALVLRPMWNLVPYTLVLHTFSHVRRYKHVRTGPSAMKLRGRYISDISLFNIFFSNYTAILHVEKISLIFCAPYNFFIIHHNYIVSLIVFNYFLINLP